MQVVSYLKRRRIIEAHIGSGKNEEEILELKISARSWINRTNKNQLSLFPELNSGEDEKEKINSSLISIDKCQYLGFRYQLLYDILWSLSVKFKFHLIPESKILNDLKKWQEESRARIITVAKKNFGFNFSLVFYDLTTLCFESFETDELRKIGFSKDNKASNPQIMIGLLVNDLGFPISYQLFAGNKFEGHTLMPSILTLKKKYKIKQMTVVADSAMISDKNVEFLKAENLHYIVAARTANLPIKTIGEIDKQLNQKDEATIRIQTASKGDLILSFSSLRYRKEKREMEKQLAKGRI